MRNYAITLLIAFAPYFIAEAEEPVYQAIEGEDATSTHYYFFYSDGGLITKVRWVWNGGAQNDPKITDFEINPRKITIRKMTGKKTTLPRLTAGADADLTTDSEYSLSCKNSQEMLIPGKLKTNLSAEQRTDLYNLISILAKDRKPLN